MRRIVSLTPSLTEIAFAVGAGDRVVGVSDYCDYPAEALKRPKIGTFLNPNMEIILALRPDLVLLDGVQGDIAAALSAAGIQVLPVPMNSLSDVRQAILRVGKALGEPERRAATELVAGLDRDLAEVQRRSHSWGRARPRVLFVVDREIGGLRGLVVAGPGTYLDEMLTRAGGDNIFSDLSLRYAKIAVEQVIMRRPEVILDAVHIADAAAGTQVIADWQELKELPAVRKGRVYLLSQRAFVTPGPRLGQALGELWALLHMDRDRG